MTFNKIVKLCEKHGFLRRIVYPKLNQEVFKIESTGVLLQENLRTEWFNDIVINKHVSVFPSVSGLAETFSFAKEVCLGTPPFGVAQITTKKTEITQPAEDDKVVFSKFFEEGTVLETCMFVTPSDSTQFFHRWQRERRMWWRKFSASPGRYVLSDITLHDGDRHSVEICAKYAWGDQVVETLTLRKDFPKITAAQLEIKDGRKVAHAQCVVSKICLSTMLLNTLCDAYEEPDFQGTPRPLLRLHRKLAPYKISFSIPLLQKSIMNELKDLALYLSAQLRKNHVSCLLTPSSHKNTLEAQWKQYDQTGVPYNVVLNENTLKTGIALMRSRDTTLKEQVHVTDLPKYVDQLFRNY